MAEVVEHLPSMCKALSANSSTANKCFIGFISETIWSALFPMEMLKLLICHKSIWFFPFFKSQF
jgi:hypothetical protein